MGCLLAQLSPTSVIGARKVVWSALLIWLTIAPSVVCVLTKENISHSSTKGNAIKSVPTDTTLTTQHIPANAQQATTMMGWHVTHAVVHANNVAQYKYVHNVMKDTTCKTVQIPVHGNALPDSISLSTGSDNATCVQSLVGVVRIHLMYVHPVQQDTYMTISALLYVLMGIVVLVLCVRNAILGHSVTRDHVFRSVQNIMWGIRIWGHVRWVMG